MATKTTGGSLYSGLLQTNQELAKAKELEANAASAGLEQGLKPLQGYLMGVAQEEKERENQLKQDQRLAIDQMNMMADTSGLLGDYEPIVTGLAQSTKDTLNNIAKDESLSQYEKAAKYKEAVDAFNKQVSKYSSDQEIIANITGRMAKGNISGGVDINSDNYKIAKALSSGNFKISGDKYIIEGLENSIVDSNRLKNLYVAEKTFDANKVSGSIAALGSATTNQEDLQRDIREYALNVGDVETARSLLIDGNLATRADVEGKDLLGLQELIIERGYKIAQKAFISAKPAAIKLSDGQIMGQDSYALLENSIANSDFSNFIGGEINPGESISGFRVTGNKVQFEVLRKGEQDPVLGATFNLNDMGQRVALGKILIDHTKATAGESLKALNTLRNMYFKPATSNETSPQPTIPEVAISDADYPKTFEGLSGIQADRKELKDIQTKIHPESLGSDWPPTKVQNYLKEENLRMTEKNIYKAYFDLGISTKTFKSRNDFNRGLEDDRDKSMQSDAMFNIAMNKTAQPTSAAQRRNFNYQGANAKIAAAALGKTVQELTTKDFEIYKWIKFSGKTKADYDALINQRNEKFN